MRAEDKAGNQVGNRAALIGVVVFVSAIAVALLARWRLAEQSAADHGPQAPPTGSAEPH